MISSLVTPAIQGGVTNYILSLVKNLELIDKKNNYYILVNESFDKILEVENANFKKIIVKLPHNPRFIMRPLYFLWQNSFIGNLFKQFQIDVFHLPNPAPQLRSFKVPFVVTIHDVAEYYNLRHSGLHSKLRMFANTTSANNASSIITVSNFSKSQIERILGVLPSKIFVTHLSSSIESYQKNYDFIINLKNKPYFIHVGGTSSNKNVERIIKSYLNSSCKGKVDLVFVGELIHNSLSSTEIKELEYQGIYFKGYVTEEELVNYYKGAMGLIYPSLYEGFGLPLLEAMALGVPVITSNCASMPEVAGDAALFVNPEDEKSIQEAIEKLYDDLNLRESLIKKGLERVKEFDWKITARKTILAYEAAVTKQ